MSTRHKFRVAIVFVQGIKIRCNVQTQQKCGTQKCSISQNRCVCKIQMGSNIGANKFALKSIIATMPSIPKQIGITCETTTGIVNITGIIIRTTRVFGMDKLLVSGYFKAVTNVFTIRGFEVVLTLKVILKGLEKVCCTC